MNRFLKILALLIVGLFLLASGVDATLDCMSRSVSQSSMMVYSQQGSVVVAYSGDLNASKAFVKPGSVVIPAFFHRT